LDATFRSPFLNKGVMRVSFQSDGTVPESSDVWKTRTMANRDIKENSKRFWSYIKSKRQEPAGISPLLNKDGFLHSDSQIKAEILNMHCLNFTETTDHW
jgi:hypothetical protein